MLRVVWIPNDAPLSIYFYPFPSLHQYFRYLPPYIQNFSSSIANNGEKITTKTPYQIRHVESKMFWDNTIPIHEEGLTRMVMWWSPPSWAREKCVSCLVLPGLFLKHSMSDSDDSQYSDEVWGFYFFLYYFIYILPLSLFVCSNFIVLKFQTCVGTFWCTWVVCTNYKGKKLWKYFNKISRRGYLLMQLHISFLYFAPGATKYVKFYIESRFSMYVLPHSN